MKRYIVLLLALIMVISFSACGSTKQSETPTTNTDIKENETVVDEQDNLDYVIDTEYYTLSAPSSWKDDCFYEIADGESYNYTLSLYDKSSHAAINGGWLFSIDLLTEFEDYSIYPDYDILGSLEVYRIGSYNIVVTYPTDVQYSEETAKKYCEMYDGIPQVLKTIKFKDECTFSEQPVTVEIVEEVSQEIVERFTGKWKHILGNIPNGASSWEAEFRTNGTGTFTFTYEANDKGYIDFKYHTIEAQHSDVTDAICIEVEDGADIYFVMKYTWSNELQKMLMTMYIGNQNGAITDLDICWVFANE